MSIYPELTFMHALGDGGIRSLSQVVVIHATDNTASAVAEASYARTRPDKTSAHFYVDDGQVIQALDTTHIAYGCLDR
jgi:N-acetylmuramoyl-L-alanine amidase CwlA